MRNSKGVGEARYARFLWEKQGMRDSCGREELPGGMPGGPVVCQFFWECCALFELAVFAHSWGASLGVLLLKVFPGQHPTS